MIRFASVERILCNALHIDARTWDQSISASMHVIDCVKRLIPGPVAGILVRLVTAGPGIRDRPQASSIDSWSWR